MSDSLLHQILYDRARARVQIPTEQLRQALVEAALLIRRAGLEHLVTEATQDEVEAMAEAGELLAKEHAALVAATLGDPASAFAPFDGGAALRRETVQIARAASRGG